MKKTPSYKETFKKTQKPKNGLLETLITRRISVGITSCLVNTNITPNQLTAISLFFAVLSGIFFALGYNYPYLVIGAVMLQISYTLDCVDGEVARYKKIVSKLGAWFDGVTDRITEFVVFIGLTIGIYIQTNNPLIVLIGMLALANILMISLIRVITRLHISSQPSHEIELGKKTYIAGVDTFIFLATITALLNQAVYLLWIYATVGALVWIRQILRVYKREK